MAKRILLDVEDEDDCPAGMITDGFGSYWEKYCEECGDEIAIMRPGDARCIRCYDKVID